MTTDRRMPEDIELEEKPCPLGCAPADEFLFTGRDRLHDLPGIFAVVRCKTCGLMRTNPRPTPETIGLYYPEDYGPYLSTRVQTGNKAGRSLPFRSIVRRLFEFNTNCLPDLPAGRMLEIGCASGRFLHQMAHRGWNVAGIEFSHTAAKNAHALGFDVHPGSVETASPPGELYDMVVGWMVLEHLHDPVSALRKLHGWTKPGGWLVVSVPNAGSYEFKLFKDVWYALQVPTHLFHYTPDTLRKVFNESGWNMTKVFHQRVLSDLYASTGYLLQDRGFKNRFVQSLIRYPEWNGRQHYLFYPLAYLLSHIGQTGRMTVWARRPSS